MIITCMLISNYFIINMCYLFISVATRDVKGHDTVKLLANNVNVVMGEVYRSESHRAEER